jgi:hypothetical protein
MTRARPGSLLASVAALGLAVACAATVPRDSIVFSHHLHSEQGLGCGDCHDAVRRDAEELVQAIPGKEECAMCHDVESADTCASCHRRADAPAAWERPPRGARHLRFSHQRHVERTEDCATCHAAVEHAAVLGPERDEIPEHAECDQCHDKDLDGGRCNLCHDRLDLYARRPEALYRHDAGFFARHGRQAAAGGPETCASCHDQAFCTDCHARSMTVRPSLRFPERVDRGFQHRGDWQSRHVIEARADRTGCLKCHGTSSCAACHERNGVGGHLGRQSPHPPEWLQPGRADSHSRQARRRIAECAGCHDQGAISNCVRCHSSGGVNPHPPDAFTGATPGQRQRENGMCQVCHGQ